MAVESKVIVTAEDRTAAAFAAIERNTGKTAMAMVKLQGQMLKLAGVGSLVAFFRSGAQSTEKWRDEMARLDEITERFFNTAAEGGRLDPFIQAVKMAYTLALGAAVAIENLGLAIGSLASAAVDVAKLNFAEASRTMEISSQDMAENEERFRKLREEINKDAPQGFAKHREEEADRVKESQKRLKSAEEERLKMILKHAEAAEDAIRAEMEISEGQSGAGLTAIGESVFNEARAKEAEEVAKADEKQRERLQKAIEDINESFLTEQELLIQQYETRQMMVDDAFMREMISEEEHTRLREELELQHQARMGDITAQGVLARRRFEEMNVKQQAQNVLGTLLQLTQGVAANNKAMFQINKLAGIANAIINTYEGVTKALSSYPPPLSIAMAAIQLGAGMAAVQQIKSAQFGIATSAPSIGGGGAIPTTNVGGLPDLSAPAQAPRPTVNLYLAGDSETVSRDWLINKFIPAYNEALGDGAANVNVVMA